MAVDLHLRALLPGSEGCVGGIWKGGVESPNLGRQTGDQSNRPGGGKKSIYLPGGSQEGHPHPKRVLLPGMGSQALGVVVVESPNLESLS